MGTRASVDFMMRPYTIHPYAKKDLSALDTLWSPMSTPDDRRKARRKLRRSHRYAKVGRTMVSVCYTCGHTIKGNVLCPCSTEGVQQKMTFKKVYAVPGDFITFTQTMI
jgi:ribosomal protein L32